MALLVSLFSGQAAEWATAVLRSNSAIALSYPEFSHHLIATLQYPHSKVETVCQGEWPVSYADKFRMLTVQTMWGDAALWTTFYEGLATRLKDELAGRELPITIEDLIQLCLQIRGLVPIRSQPFNPLLLQLLGSVPFHQLHGSNKSGLLTMQLGRTSLSPEERERQCCEGLCTYYATRKHNCTIAIVCPLHYGNRLTR